MKKIGDPLSIGRVQLPSRVVFGPIATNLADGRAFSDRHSAFYRERAAGGCGMVVTEHASIHRSDWPYERSPDASEAGRGWTDIAKACAEFDTVTIAGLNHAGGQSTSAFSQRELWAPSDEPDVNTREVPKIMERSDIDEVVAGFAAATSLAIDSGMAGVEINAGQFSLIRQFLSGLTNRREDAYGEDKSLLARQVLEAARAAVGDGLIGLRLSCDELAPWAGLTPDAAAGLAADFAPLVDYITVVRGAIFSMAETRPTAHHGTGFNLDLAGQVRAAVRAADGDRVPIIGQGSIVTAEQADEAIGSGRCDAVEMTRAQLADPQLVNRVRAGSPIRPCVLCNQLCNVRDNRNPIISCIANPRAGHEMTDAPEPTAATPSGAADDRREPDVLIVGAGPAGLEAARVSARRGLRVVVHEAGERAGGMAAVAAAAPAHGRLVDLISWLEEDAVGHGAQLRYGTPVTAAEIAAFDGEVIVATGSVVGPRSYEAAPDAEIVDAVEVLEAVAAGGLDALVADRQVAVWDPTGGAAAIAVTELIAGAIAASGGSAVRFITPDANAATMLSLTGDLAGANVRLQQAGVEIVKRQRLLSVSADSVETVHAFTGERQTIAADLLVDVAARHPNEELWAEAGGDHVRIGDAVAPRTVAEAIREGRAAGMALRATGNASQGGVA